MRNGEIKREKRLYKKGIRELHDSVGEYIPVRGQRNRGGEMINRSWKLTVMVLPVGRRLFGRYCFFSNAGVRIQGALRNRHGALVLKVMNYREIKLRGNRHETIEYNCKDRKNKTYIQRTQSNINQTS